MYALIENNEIKETFSNIRALRIGDVQYPKNIFTVWSEAERNAIGIYEIVQEKICQMTGKSHPNTAVKILVNQGAALPI